MKIPPRHPAPSFTLRRLRPALLGALLSLLPGLGSSFGQGATVTTDAVQNLNSKSFDTSVDNAQKYASFSAAITAIGSNTRTLLIPQPLAVTANITVPANITLQFWGAGRLDISNNVIVTIDGRVEADRRLIFNQAITANTGVRFAAVEDSATAMVYPEWWGAVPDPGTRTTDSTDGLQRAINAVDGWRKVSLGSCVYMFSNLTLPAVTYLIGEGNHVSILMRTSSSTGTGITDSGNAAKITLQDFSIYCRSRPGTALELGFNAYQWGTEGLIRRVMVRDSGGAGVRLYGNVAFIENLYVQSCVGTQFYIQGDANIISMLQIMGDYGTANGVEIASSTTKIYGLHLEGIFATPLTISGYGNTIHGATASLSANITITDLCKITAAGTANGIQDLYVLKFPTTTVTNAVNDLYAGRQYSLDAFGAFVNYSQYSQNPLGVSVVNGSLTLPNYYENQTIVAQGLTSNITITLPQLSKSYDHRITVINTSPTYTVTVSKSGSDVAGTKVAGASNSITLAANTREFLAISPTDTEWLAVGGGNGGTVNASTGNGAVKMGNGNSANSAGWMALRKSDGTKVYVPYWNTPTP